jgi:hypothetical protein
MPPPIYVPTDHPFRLRPAEYIEDAVIPGLDFALPAMWWQNDVPVNVPRHKKHYHWIWPKDGKNGSKWGRIKDIASGKGPDIHVTISANRMDYMHNRQRRSRWANWMELNDQGPDGMLNKSMRWVGDQRDPNRRYDYWRRQYGQPNFNTTTDAYYQGPFRKQWPNIIRDMNGDIWQDIHPLP